MYKKVRYVGNDCSLKKDSIHDVLGEYGDSYYIGGQTHLWYKKNLFEEIKFIKKVSCKSDAKITGTKAGKIYGVIEEFYMMNNFYLRIINDNNETYNVLKDRFEELNDGVEENHIELKLHGDSEFPITIEDTQNSVGMALSMKDAEYLLDNLPDIVADYYKKKSSQFKRGDRVKVNSFMFKDKNLEGVIKDIDICDKQRPLVIEVERTKDYERLNLYVGYDDVEKID